MVDKTCRSCGKYFTVKNYRRNTAIFCSMRCINVGRVPYNKGKKGLQGTNRSSFKKGLTVWNKNLKGIHLSPGSEFKKGMKPLKSAPLVTKHCKNCKQEFQVPNYLLRVKCCSRTCAGKLKGLNETGEKHWNWKGGVTPKDRLERMKFRRELQKKVFIRDNYTCQNCGAAKDLQVDHIQPWSDFVEERFNINNCRTLCAGCHYQITFGRLMPQNIKGWGHNLIGGVSS